MATSKYPNQITITIGEKEIGETEARISSKVLQQACNELSGVTFKLWIYLVKNSEGYQFGLSPSACEKWGISRFSYYKAKDELIDKGYLIENGAASYIFHEEPIVLESIREVALKGKKFKWLGDHTIEMANGKLYKVLPF